ncbi:hypothetical protein P7K49_031304 [Saguinus oedipus]|uniref:Lysozyme like 4 n=1 Tax=Saguinus oedipus TaxID=9490 RepID=A0ABQ9TZ05_SAGOE|nr:hypothetical protein P7K49_031304 [Saguinus oedipus]
MEGLLRCRRLEKMKAGLVLSLLGCLVVPRGAYILGRCTVAKKLRDGGLDYFEGYSLENWVCLAYFESKFNPTAVYENTHDGYTGFGLFQIRGSDWCGDRGRNRCHVSCSGYWRLWCCVRGLPSQRPPEFTKFTEERTWQEPYPGWVPGKLSIPLLATRWDQAAVRQAG